jgi:hypothetical protein
VTAVTQRATPGSAFGAALLMALAFGLQASWAARADSVTIDGFVHLPVGLYALRTGVSTR